MRTSTHTLQRCPFPLHHPLSATTSLAVGLATTAAHMRIMTPANFQTRQSTLYWNLMEVILLTMPLLSATLGWMPRTPITCPTVWDPGAGSTQVVCMHSRKWIFSHCIMVAVVVISTNTRGHHRPMLTYGTSRVMMTVLTTMSQCEHVWIYLIMFCLIIQPGL